MNDATTARRAALILLRRTLNDLEMLDESALPPDTAPQDRARGLTLARTALRWLNSADAVLGEFIPKAPVGEARDILRLGVIEILVLKEAPYGVVDAAVRIAKSNRRTHKQSGMINAVLRRVSEEGPEIWADIDHGRQTTTDWFYKLLRRDWGKTGAAAICEAHLVPAPLDLTVKGDPASWAETLGGIVTPTGSVRLARPGRLSALTGFETGDWWAQDAAAAVPARLVGAGDGKRALDLCAAPGGKTMQLAAQGWDVTALDISDSRMARVKENLTRTQLKATTVVADAMEWQSNEMFDLVLLDAPCSATGTVRRHPELPHIRGEGSVEPLRRMQRDLANAAWDKTAPGGMMVYCTCALTMAEGEARAKAFLTEHEDAARVPYSAEELGDPILRTRAGDYRARPDMWSEIGGMDGFFAARFQKAG
ncbi:MAG: RsmB/NOP family class I SAM-dependent RNA methyltransferase [Pikeienuella sp.]